MDLVHAMQRGIEVGIGIAAVMGTLLCILIVLAIGLELIERIHAKDDKEDDET